MKSASFHFIDKTDKSSKSEPLTNHSQVIESPESFKNLTEKQACLEKTERRTVTQAVMNSYEVTSKESVKVIGLQLLSKPEIQLNLPPPCQA